MATVTDIQNLPESAIEIAAELPWNEFAAYEKEALSTLGANIEVPGFRKGNVPEDMLRKELGDDLILTDMAERAIAKAYLSIMQEKHIVAIGRPAVSITKIARGNALTFTITTSVMPTFSLPDYKALAAATPESEAKPVSDEDITKVVEELRELKAYGHIHAPGTEHQHEETLPSVDDAFAKSFGNFSTVEELRAKVKENLIRERERDALDKRRLGIIENIMGKTDIVVPDVLTAAEAEKMLAQIEIDVSRAGHTLEAYLKETGKTRDQLLDDYKPEAQKRAKMQLILNAIATDASITVSEEELTAETDRLMQTYPGADRERSRAYAQMILTNEKVLKMLEEEK